jgi:predicted unusual protein kinase regulating ubiquinone biosynthesis (AarF/ABC1/UbiB family)
MRISNKAYRMWKILSVALILFLNIYWAQITKKSSNEKEKMWEKMGKKFKETLFELEGPLIKIGQLLSIRADLLPDGFIKQIQDLADQVPPSQWKEIERVLVEEWDGPIASKLQTIDKKAIASASIGEVYKGLLNDGTVVAIKVQRPTIQTIVKTDFRSLSIIFWFVKKFAPIPKGFVDFNKLYQELKEVIEKELDFQKEMQTLLHFHHRFAHLPFIKVPQIHQELCTSRVLVMEWVEGSRLTDTQFMDQHLIDRQLVANRLCRLFFPQWLEPGMFHADPHAGNLLIQRDGTIVLLDFGMAGEVSKQDTDTFQELLLAILVNDFKGAVRSLQRLGFIRKNSNLMQVEEQAKELLMLDVKKFQEMNMVDAKKEMNKLIQSLPIQIPTRFVFLGRSLATIEGILRIVNPTEDVLATAKPVLMEWIKNHPNQLWKMILQWIRDQYFLRMFNGIYSWIKVPDRLMEQNVQQQTRDFHFRIYETYKMQSGQFGMAGIIGIIIGWHLHSSPILGMGVVIVAVSCTVYIVSKRKQRKWFPF